MILILRSQELCANCTALRLTPARIIRDNDQMSPASSPSTIAVATAPFSTIDADLLIVPWFKDEGADAVPLVDAATGGELKRALSSNEFQGKAYDTWLTPVADAGW